MRGFRPDESRFGVLTVRRRRLTAGGVQPLGPVRPVCEWFYVDGAVAPTTGERVFLALPYLNADMCPLVSEAVGQAFPDRLNIRLLDNGGAHTAPGLRWPEHVRSVWLPPYGPELSPSARVWLELKDELAWCQFTTRDAQQAYVGDL